MQPDRRSRGAKLYIVKPRKLAAALAAVAAWFGPLVASHGDSVVVEAIRDNTLIEDAAGAVSNGAGDGFFCGRLGSNGGGLRLRAVLMFDLSAIPAGSTINSASMRLVLVQGHGGTQSHSVYRLLKNWGEGTSFAVGGNGVPSTPNDATWIHTFYSGSYWTNPGGDYLATASATASVGNSGSATWSSAAMAADVQHWINNPTENFGWIIRGNEVTLATAKKFVSHNWLNNEDAPRLTINFTPPPPDPCEPDLNEDGEVAIDDLLTVIGSWGACPPLPADCPSDIAPPGGDGTVNIDDLLRIIGEWGPCR